MFICIPLIENNNSQVADWPIKNSPLYLSMDLRMLKDLFLIG